MDIQATELEFEEDIHTLSVFSPVIEDICQGSAGVKKLLSCARLSLLPRNNSMYDL